MVAILAFTFVLACGEEPAPATGAGTPAPSADEAMPATSPPKERKRVVSTAPPLPEADRQVTAEVQAAIDLLTAEPGDPAAARTALDQWIASHPDDVDARYWRARASMKTMAWSDAEADVRLVIDAAPDWVNARDLLGGALAVKRRCEEAIPHLDRVVELLPEHHIGYMNRGSCRYRVGDIDGSITDAEKACELGNDRACRTIKQLERRKIWKANLEKRKAAEAASTLAPEGGATPP